MVLVPSTGFLYFNLLLVFYLPVLTTVLVPSTGFLYFNKERPYVIISNPMFSSPPRGSYISIRKAVRIMFLLLVLVPSTGFLYFNK